MKKEFYREHRIPKKDGSLRVLEIPSDELKAVQRDYYEHEVLNGLGPTPSGAFGVGLQRIWPGCMQEEAVGMWLSSI